MPVAQIVMSESEIGVHHRDPKRTYDRIYKGNTYRDSSTVILIPAVTSIAPKVVQSWFQLMMPMNQKAARLFGVHMEVGDSYNAMIDGVLRHPELSTWQYILTLETDNMPPPDGLLRLYESMGLGYDVVGGLYFCKGETGQPMAYGDPGVMPRNYIPQLPKPNSVMPVNGLGMGFTLFKLKIFKDERIARPWFQTIQEYRAGQGPRSWTQDLTFFDKAAGAGYRFACDARVRVGHYDAKEDIVW